MYFPYDAFAMKPNTNEMYKPIFYLYYTMFFFKIKYFIGHIKSICIFVSNIYWIVSHKSILGVPNANVLTFSDPMQL